MTIHWKAVEQHFTVVLFVNPLTTRVKPWVIQSSLSFDFMYRTLKCDRSLESCLAVLYCGVCYSILFVILEKFINFRILDLALSGVKGLVYIIPPYPSTCRNPSIIFLFVFLMQIATSVAARGLDVKQLILVINYDCPNHYEDYVHRCG